MARSFVLFLTWTLVGFVGSFALLYGFTPVGPIIVLGVWLAYRYMPRISGHRLPEAAGALGGFGVFWLFVATTVDGDASAFATVGVISTTVSLGWYVTAGRQRCGRQPQTS
jgi:hypothetical protein